VITVFVWDMKWSDKAGHASMQVENTYISWWPEHYRSDVGLGVRGNRLAWGGPSYANTMTEDKQHKGRLPDYASPPIEGLDKGKILRWWAEIGPSNNSCQLTYSADENTHYDLARLSCATIVMRGLLVGGAGAIVQPGIPKLATAAKGLAAGFGPLARVLAEEVIGSGITPADVKAYANRLVSRAKH